MMCRPRPHGLAEDKPRIDNKKKTNLLKDACKWHQKRKGSASYNRPQRMDGITDIRSDTSNSTYEQKEDLADDPHALTKEQPYKCRIGVTTFSIRNKLVKPKRLRKEERPLQCNLSDVELEDECQLNDHQSEHTDEGVKYNIDNTAFTIRNKLDELQGLPNKEKSFPFNLCDRDIKEKTQSNDPQSEHSVKEKLESGVGNEAFSNVDLLDENESLLSIRNRIRNQLFEHARLQSVGKPYICEVCYKSFKQKGHFIVHQRVHTGEKPFKCDECDKSFTKKNNLTVHKQGKHTGEKRFICKMCTKSFAQKCQLIAHERVHTGEKPFVCFTCYKSFPRKYNLTLHEKIHTGERPFRCDICSRSFALKRNLTVHNKRKHSSETQSDCDKTDTNCAT